MANYDKYWKEMTGGVDLSRNQSLAGQTVSSNGQNVTYDENGYATNSKNYGHKLYEGTDQSVAAPSIDTVLSTADRNSYGGSVYDQNYFSDAELREAANIRNMVQSGQISLADGNRLVENIRAKYGYSGGADGSGYTPLDLEKWNPDISQGFGVLHGGQAGLSGLPGGNYGYGSGYGSISGGGGGNGIYAGSDASEYLKQMYAQNISAQLANLQSAYQQNVADLQAQAEQIPEIYQASRNETAAQNDLARQSFNEYAVARGLNTGSSGQAALANSAVLQNNLANISSQESNALADNALEQQRLAIAYRNAVAEAQATGNAELASALYQEYVRQDNLAAEAAAAAQAQKNWEAEFGFTQQQYNDDQSVAQRESSYNLAMTMLQAGLMPDSSTLAAAGISTADALAMQKQTAQPTTGSSSNSSAKSSSSSVKTNSKNTASKNELENAEIDMQSVLALGYGPINEDYLYQLEQEGKIKSYLQNGKIKFQLVGDNKTPSVKSGLLNTVF